MVAMPCFGAETLGELNIREHKEEDAAALWTLLLEPSFRAGATFCVAQDISQEDALAFWNGGGSRRAYIAELPTTGASASPKLLGSYFIAPIEQGNGAHVATSGFITVPDMQHRGVARAMLRHAIQTAAVDGFRAMQLNVYNPQRPRKCIWRQAGFVEVGKVPKAFAHPSQGYLDALILHREIGHDDLLAWFHDVRAGTGSQPVILPADDEGDPDTTVHPVSQMGPNDEYRKELLDQKKRAEKDQKTLPEPQRLPPPTPIVVLDEAGYVADSWSPADLCLRLAYSLDAMFSPLPPVPDAPGSLKRKDGPLTYNDIKDDHSAAPAAAYES